MYAVDEVSLLIEIVWLVIEVLESPFNVTVIFEFALAEAIISANVALLL